MNPFFRLPLLIILGLMLCSWQVRAESEQQTEKIILQFKWLHAFQFAGYYAAKEKGFYAEEQLDVEMRESLATISAIDQVLSGEAHYGVADTALLQERLNGKPVVVLASIFQHNPLVLVTLRKSGIVSPYELIGKRIMNNPKTDAPLVAMYYETGIDINKIIHVENTFNINDLINGRVDAFASYLTDQIDDLTQRGIAFNIIDPRNYGVDFLGDNLFTTEQEIVQHPERVKRFLRASLKGWDYALKNPDEIIQLILKKYNPHHRLTEAHLRFEAKETAKMILPNVIPLGNTDIKRFQRIAQTYQRLGLVNSIDRLQGFIYGQQGLENDFTLVERAWLRAHPLLVVGIHTDFPPFEWLDEKDNHVGLSADYMKLVADYLGVKIEIVTGQDWTDMVEKAKYNQIDMLSNVTQTPSLEQYLGFSEPYLNYPIVIIDNGKEAYVRDLHQLSGKRVAVVRGHFVEELLKRDHPELQLNSAKNVQAALKKLHNGEVDAYVGDPVSANYIIKKEGLFDLRFTGETEYRRKTSMATHKENKVLLNLINKALIDITPVQQNHIQNRWLRLQAEQQTISLENVLKYGAAVLLLLIFILYWNIRLQRAIAQSKKLEAELRRNEAKLYAIINACPIPLSLNDDNQQINFVNPEFIKCFGYTLKDIPTLNDWWLHAYPDSDYRQHAIKTWLPLLTNIKQGCHSFEPIERTIRCKDGTTRTVMVSAASLGDQFEKHYLAILYDVTTRKQAESELQQSLNLLRSVINNIPIRVFWKDLNYRYLGCNQTFIKDIGLKQIEQLIGKDDYMICPTAQADIYREEDTFVIRTASAKLNIEKKRTLFNGENRWIRSSKVPLYNEANHVIGMLGIYEDITDSKQAEENLRLAASVFANTQEGIVITDLQGNILNVNQAFTKITGYERDEIIGKNPKILQSKYHNSQFYQELWITLKKQNYWHGEIWNRRKNGETYPEWLTISSVFDENQDIVGYIGTFSDISLLKQREEQLEQMTHYDPLTGVANRVLLIDRMNLAIAQTKRNNNLLAVCYLDLDAFKQINDTLGNALGDQILIETTQRIKQTLREEDTIARLGGDEFVFLLQDIERIEDCELILLRLLQAISNAAFTLEEKIIHMSASIGISIFPEDNSSPETLLRHATQAMYQAKQEGKNTWHIYNIALDKKLHSHRIALNRIELALKNNEFELFFQPKVDMRQGKVFGVEALIRWQHSERGLVMPGEFLPLIENNEFANRLDEWVINRALQHIEQWQAQGLMLKVSINISARSLQSVDFVNHLKIAFNHYPNVNRRFFELEILETEVLNDLEATSCIIKNCQELGVQFALDDFGTGYSSLSYLRRLPIQTLKIDQSFVRDMLEDENDLTIVRSVIGLADSFKRDVIAEGVESIEHGTVLMAMGCHQAQGYAIAKPMPEKDFLNWLQHWQMPDEWKTPH